ncbi:hypothetical protein [Pseudofrankia sp. BMG5.37]|uniref:hypothetical protein n=1 Tax=Pseudofrankia sp. BMG5.37 TaxID=3050035 RepID=UPI002895FCA3|nr:hypothetical protein [Pseudofrankia sp. BMG5.37]MDT3446177.1 hypothetical protein [Pseudofrankia sp. BMG5.37]
MTARAEERTATGRAGRVPNLLLAVTALAAALLGWALLFQDRPPGKTIAVILVAVAVGWLVAALLARPLPVREGPPEPARGRPPEPAGGRPPGPARERPPGPDSRWSGPASDGAGLESAQLVLPVGRAAGGTPQAGQWWNRASPAPAEDARPTESVRPAPRDLAALRDSARVVQCPRCGAFRIDVRHLDTGYAFRCRVDGHEWTWRPGTAWPLTVVASRRRHAT